MPGLSQMFRGALTRTAALAALLVGGGCVEQAEEKPNKEDLEFIKKNLLSTAPKPQFAVNGDLDGKVVYLGLDASANPIEPGKDVKLVHYWKVVSAPGTGWRSFVHVNGPNNQTFINFDHPPLRGKYPVAQWKDGEIIRDEHNIRLPVTWPHDKVLVYTGLWRGNERLPIKSGPKDEGGRLLAATIPVQRTTPAPSPAKRYLVRKIAKPLKLDGKLDEPAWKDAPSTGLFVDTLTGAPAAHRTEAKLLWDAQNLYIGFENADADVWSTLNKRDDKLWTQEAVEIMIDADRNGKTYTEFQVAPNGNVFDTYLPEWRKYENTLDPKRQLYDWNSKIKAGVNVIGTLNKREDQDKGWVAEIAIPLGDVSGLGTATIKIPPQLGDTWRLNMFRMDVPKGEPQKASAWSPPLVGDFHALDKFGEIVFADDKGQVPATNVAAAPAAPAAPAVKRDPHAVMRDALGGLKAEGGGPGVEAARKNPAARRKKIARETDK
jgi:hypothetical protein